MAFFQNMVFLKKKEVVKKKKPAQPSMKQNLCKCLHKTTI